MGIYDFPDRLRELRGNKTFREFSKQTNISRYSLSNYERRLKVPSIEVLYNICKRCGVSADYMIGLVDDKQGIECGNESV